MGKKSTSSQADAAVFSQLQAELAELKKENAELHRKLARMNELLLNAQRARFGQSSEKQTYVMQGGQQLGFFNEAEVEQDHKAAEPTEKTIAVAAHERKSKRTVDELTKDLPVKTVVLELDEAEQFCSACGEPLKRIGKKFVRRELEIIPKQVRVIEYYTATYACEACEKRTGYANIYSIAPPPTLLKHSLASPSTVADIMVRKYVDALPLARQEKIWAREGVELSRATMANWVIQVARTWLKPLYHRLKTHLLSGSVIHADETVVQVLKEDGKPATSESRMWVYASSDRSGKPVRYFEYQPDRSGKHAAAFLRGFSGCLVTDGYAGYNQVEGVVRCGCWAHMRRKWREAMPKGATKATSKAAVGYDYCSKLFALERKYAGLSDAVRKTARQVGEEPLLEAYWLWLKTVDPVPGSKLAEAVTYAWNQKPYLSAFLDHGEVDISNNFVEIAIRPFAVGRKNWLFSDTPKGAESSAIVYTLVETAMANGLDPYAYLLRILTDLPWLGKNPKHEDLDSFMPWSVEIRSACAAPKAKSPNGDL
jgi:transposase